MGNPLSKEIVVFLVIAVLAVGYVVMDMNNAQTSNDVAGQGYKSRCLKTLEVFHDNWLSVGEVLSIKTSSGIYTMELLESNNVYSEGNPNQIDTALITVNGGEPFWVLKGQALDYPNLVIIVNGIKKLSSETQENGVIGVTYIVGKSDPLKKSCNPKLKHSSQWISKNEQINLKPYGNSYNIELLNTKKIQAQSGEFKSAELNVNGKSIWFITQTNGVYYNDLFWTIKDIKKLNTPTKQTDVALLDYVYVE